MTYAALFLGLIAFVLLLRRLSVVQKVREAGTGAREAMAVMRNRALDDRDKEARVQRAATQTAVSFLAISARCLLAVAVPTALVVGGASIGLYSVNDAMRAATDPIVLVVLTLSALVLWKVAP